MKLPNPLTHHNPILTLKVKDITIQSQIGREWLMKVIKEKIKKYYPLLFSLIIPGFGQLARGQWKKGLLIMISPLICYGFIILSIIFFGGLLANPELTTFFIIQGLIAMVIIYIWQIIDIYRANNNYVF